MDKYLPIKKVVGTRHQHMMEEREKYNIQNNQGGYTVNKIPDSSVYSGHLRDVYYKLNRNDKELENRYKDELLAIDGRSNNSKTNDEEQYDARIYVPKRRGHR